MAFSCANEELAQMYDAGLSLEEMALETGYEVSAIKNTLLQISSRYRAEARLVAKREGAKPQITDEEDDAIIEALKNIVYSSDNDMVRVKAAIYLHDEKKGRNDARLKQTSGVNINVLMLNSALKKVRQIDADVKSIIDLDNVRDVKEVACG